MARLGAGLTENGLPEGSLERIFTQAALRTLRAVQAPSDALRRRLEVLDAHRPNPASWQHRELLSQLRKVKAAWEAYCDAAIATDLLDADLAARLTSPDDANFRSGMSECLVAWFVAGKLKHRIAPRPSGRAAKVLDFAIDATPPISVEVKAPYRELKAEFFWGDDSDALEAALAEANEQFASNGLNVLAIVPHLRLRVCPTRAALVRAFIGEQVIQIPIDPKTGGPAGPDSTGFKLSGRFVTTKTERGTRYKPDGTPRYTRVGAVLCIEEALGRYGVEHDALVLHNPHAASPIPEDLWDGIPQFVCRGDSMLWSDLHPITPF